MKPLAENRKARFDIAVEETIEAGIVLTGDEIKSIRAGRVQLTGAYVRFMQGNTPVLIGMHLALANEPDRTRKLLLHGTEISDLASEISVKGKTAVPLSINLRRGWAKVSIGIGRGRKTHDKRQVLRERDLERQAGADYKYKK